LAIQYCDDVLIMVKGRALTQGNAQEIMQPDLLEKIFGVPFVKFERDGRTYINY
jgi:iron complex transport system ATP-binding protein